MAVEQHKKEAPGKVKCMILTVSDTRTKETDKSGQIIKELVLEQGHEIHEYRIVKDEYNDIQHALMEVGTREDIDAVLVHGGTGIAMRDTTYEAVKELLDKEMPGFGEIFRYLSYTEDIGTAAILSRAVAGVYRQKAVFSMPGSSGAVRLAMQRIILPELGHVIREIHKDLK